MCKLEKFLTSRISLWWIIYERGDVMSSLYPLTLANPKPRPKENKGLQHCFSASKYGTSEVISSEMLTG